MLRLSPCELDNGSKRFLIGKEPIEPPLLLAASFAAVVLIRRSLAVSKGFKPPAGAASRDPQERC